MTKVYTKTSEFVAPGHPDKVADQLSDTVFDYLRTFKKNPQSAVEVACGATKLLVFGEIDNDVVFDGLDNKTFNTTEREVEQINPVLVKNIKKLIQEKLIDIGYSKDLYDPEIIINLVIQSEEINNAVEENEEHEYSAGDQGIVTGYAIKETEYYHNLHYILSQNIIKTINDVRINNSIKGLYPDAKSQVTIEYQYNEKGIDTPIAIKNVLLSQSYSEQWEFEEIQHILSNEVIRNIILFIKNDEFLINKEQLIDSLDTAEILINPAGAWTTPGPKFDSGLTGRKLVVDNYGSSANIGGGATSGKNSNKVDRSGAYYARYIAKNIVAQGLAEKCLVELSFAIGIPEITSINIETYGTEKQELHKIFEYIKQQYSFKVKDMIDLCDTINYYVKASELGNYTNPTFPWEKIK